MIIYEKNSDFNFDNTRNIIIESLSEYGFSVLFEMNFKDKFKEKGIPFNKDIKILEICNPILAKGFLEADLNASYLLPCKLVITDTGTGVKVGMKLPTELVKDLNSEVIKEYARRVEENLKDAIRVISV